MIITRKKMRKAMAIPKLPERAVKIGDTTMVSSMLLAVIVML